MRNELALLALRPDLGLDTTQSSPAETFQNRTLRPVLKMQHEVLLHIFQHYIRKRKNAFVQRSPQAQLEYITHSVRHDAGLRHLLAGAIAGHFTLTELSFFLENEADVMKRLADLIVQRLQSDVVSLRKNNPTQLES